MHQQRPSSRIHRRQLLGLGAGVLAGLCLPRVARAGVELTTLQLSRVDGALMVVVEVAFGSLGVDPG